jgi:1,4-alpha-glucan branching enzyme
VITNKSTSSSDWLHVPSWSVWGTTPPQGQATYLGNNKWSYTITGGLNNFFNITDPTEVIQKIAILFRSGNGAQKQANSDNNDMFVPVYGSNLAVRIDAPPSQPEYVPVPQALNLQIGSPLPITANANQPSTVSIYFNGTQLQSASNVTTASANATITAVGNQQIIATATNTNGSSSDTINFLVSAPTTFAQVPAGDSDGINYEAGDTSVTLVLNAPHKNHIFVVGDFNNWVPSTQYQMYETPDSSRFWIRINGLTSGTEYGYQYLIDDTIKVADYNTEKVLDPNVDPQIPASTYPNLKPYPTGLTTGYVSVLQPGNPAYTWGDANFVRPDKRNLIIYELLVRDFIAAENWATLTDTLTYLKRLGVNAIEVMPFINFSGYSSWGYNPNFYFAPDKVYGPGKTLKHFIDVCHQNGIAVIMDLTMDDVDGSSPLATMYWNNTAGTPAANNPWLNQTPTTPFVPFYQFNHSSPNTIKLRNRVYAHWLKGFHLDGFRFDLASGYTQTNYGTNESNDTWETTYDQGRVNTWDSIYSKLQSIAPGSYCILESFLNQPELQTYLSQGMLTWGGGSDMNYAATQSSMGYNTGWDLSSGLYSKQGFTQPGMVDYQESHDETVGGDERVVFKNENYGNSSGSYNIKDTATALQRAALTTTLWAMIPGPKMMLMFGELGYDYSPAACSNGTLACGNTDPKPLPWAKYYTNASRQALYHVYSKLFNLRNNPAYLAAFTNNGNASNTNYNMSGAIKWISNYSPTAQVVAFGNFDVVQQTGTVSFPSTGTWYNLFTGADTTISTTSLVNITLQPGQYAVYVNNNSALPVTWLSFTAQKGNENTALLNWSTGQEINNSYFGVERSIDGITYSTIGSVPAGQAAASVQNYSFTDASPASGINYYRLKQVDKDGQFTYSKVATVTIAGSKLLWQVYPNPAHSGTAVYINANLGKVQLVLTDAAGKRVYQQDISSATAGQQIVLPVNQLTKGVYLLQVISGKASGTEKIVVQ